MKKIHKILLCVMIIIMLVSLLVLPCLAYGGDRYNSVIASQVLPTSLNWDVTFELEGTSYYDDPLSTSVNFKFDPVFPVTGLDDIYYSRTHDETESEIPMPNAGYDETVRLFLDTDYDYDNNHVGFVNVGYKWSINSYESDISIVGVQYQVHQFYYTYDPDIVPAIEGIGGPYGMYFHGASSVTTTVYYHTLGNAIDSYVVSYTAENDSTFYPSLFGYTDDESFTIFIDRVVVTPNYDDLSVAQGGFDMEYSYDGAYCQFARASDLDSHITPPSDAAFGDYTSWIGVAVSGFLDFQIFPGFSFGALLMVIISFSTVMWFLKLFAGG